MLRPLGVVVASGVAAASFGFASVQVFGGTALAVTPTLTTVASPNTEVGLDIFDNANLAGGDNPTGTITFDLYGPEDTNCATSIFTSDVPVNGNGSYNSESHTTTQAGTYQWRARYSGDANNDSVTTACNDPAEQVIVAKASTVLTTTASASVAVGGQITDTAHLRGGFNPTGTIDFDLHGPGDTFCSATPVFEDTVTVNGNGDYVSDPFTPLQAGEYKWRARYNGDSNNLGDGPTACLDPDGTVIVTGGLITPTLTTTASGPISVGGQMHDTAQLSGGLDPTGTITFDLYGPDDANCSGALADTSNATVNGNGQYTSAMFSPTLPGTYRYVARYSGDTAHNPVATACNDPAESVVVSPGSGSTTTSSSTTSTSTTSSTTTTSTTSTTSTTMPTTSTTSTTTSTTSTTTSTTSTTTPTTSTTSTTTPTTSSSSSSTTSSSTTSSSTTSSSTTSSSTTSTTSPSSSTSSSVPTSTSSTTGPTTTSSTTSTTLAPTSTTSSTTVPGSTTSSIAPTSTSSTSSSVPTDQSPTSTVVPTGTTSSSTSSSTTPPTGGASTTTTTTVAGATTTTSAPAGGGATLGVTPQSVAAGQAATVFGNGFPAGRPVDVVLFSTPALLGSPTADAVGSFRITATIPADTSPGPHRVVGTVRGGGAQAETVLVVTSSRVASPAPRAIPPGQLSRTGSATDVAVPVAGALVVVGLLIVAGFRMPGRSNGLRR